VAENRSPTNQWDGMKIPPGFETASNIVLSVSPNKEDSASLERIFKSGWTVIATATVAFALSVLREIQVPVIICDCEISSGTWAEMLVQLSLLPDPPLLIVTSRLADERLWVEALNLGAWDVLAKPFDAAEVIRIIGVAWQHWQDRRGVHIPRIKPGKSASGSGHLAATG
jgi:DNA-binding response OmpR family regulator